MRKGKTDDFSMVRGGFFSYKERSETCFNKGRYYDCWQHPSLTILAPEELREAIEYIKSHVSDETAKVSTLLTATACFI